MGIRGDGAEDPLELADAVAHRVVVEELGAGRLGHVEVRVESTWSVSRRSAASGVRSESGPRTSAANDVSSAPSGTRASSRWRPSWSKRVTDPPPCTRRPISTARWAWRNASGSSPSPFETRLTPAEKAIRPPPRSPRTAAMIRSTATWASVGSAGSTGTRVTTSRLKATDAIVGSTVAETCRHAWAKRSCHARRSSGSGARDAIASGSSTATTTITGRSRCQPNACACSATYSSSPARSRNTSRRKSPRYLFSTAVIASTRVTSSAATIAARSSACTSEEWILPSGRSATSRARSTPAATTRRTSASPLPAAVPSGSIRSTRTRPVGSSSSASVIAARCASSRCAARSRPSVEVKTTPQPSALPTASAIAARSPPSSTMCVRAVWSASARSSAATASGSLIKSWRTFTPWSDKFSHSRVSHEPLASGE